MSDRVPALGTGSGCSSYGGRKELNLTGFFVLNPLFFVLPTFCQDFAVHNAGVLAPREAGVCKGCGGLCSPRRTETRDVVSRVLCGRVRRVIQVIGFCVG